MQIKQNHMLARGAAKCTCYAGFRFVGGSALLFTLLLQGGNAWAQSNSPSAAGDSNAAGARLWPGTEFPLPLQVGTPEELAFKALAEQQYLRFNLLASGKYAYDQGRYDVAVAKWQALLSLEGVEAGTRNVVAPLLKRAQAEAPASAGRSLGSSAGPVITVPVSPVAPGASSPALPKVTGLVSGGGRVGPGGAVLWLKRKDAPMPATRPAPRMVVNQKNKMFVPHVLAIPLGTEVAFRNDDEYYHNVFSISEPAKFDTGLYKSGAFAVRRFTKPGAVQLLCNIHSTMLAYLYVVDSPYYAQPTAQGAFRIPRVPPGSYDLFAWHESSSQLLKQQIEVGPGGLKGIVVHMPADEPPVVSLPDKYGKPRQAHLGY